MHEFKAGMTTHAGQRIQTRPVDAGFVHIDSAPTLAHAHALADHAAHVFPLSANPYLHSFRWVWVALNATHRFTTD
jgi:hypothetical protein